MTTHTTDREERSRVRSRIGSLIMEFFRHNNSNTFRTFHMELLRKYVEMGIGGKVAPDSPGRIMRQLRQEGFLDYIVVSRRQSLYRVAPVEGPAEPFTLANVAGVGKPAPTTD